MKISFCTTCMGRTHHLKQTLLQNIEDNLPQSPGAPDVEFIVLDYNSKDGLRDWILNDPNLTPYLESGLLKYARETEAEHFKVSHAKNMAHRLATGDIVCNVDADNFTGRGFATYLSAVFAEEPNAIVTAPMWLLREVPADLKGFGGRVAMSRENFTKLTGYDERIQAWAEDDTDIIMRALSMGLHNVPLVAPTFTQVIPHADEERLVNRRTEDRAEALKNLADSNATTYSWDLMKNKLSGRFDSVSHVQKNCGGRFGEGMVEIGREETPYILGPAERLPASSHYLHAGLQYMRMLTGF